MNESTPTPLPAEEVEAYRLERTKGDRSRIEWSGFKVFSQPDDDGIIEHIFSLIGAPHRTFVEFGCETGLENNTRYLLEQGWRGLWMEGNPDYATGVRGNHHEALVSGQLAFHETFVTPDNINDLLRQHGFTGEIDFLSIDIDSIDYYVFDAIDAISPRVVCLEHNHTYAPGEEWVMPYSKDFRWDPAAGAAPYGASITSLARLAERKGYVLVGCGLCSANGFYVRSDLVGTHFTGPFTPERLFNPLVYEMMVRFPTKPRAETRLPPEPAVMAPVPPKPEQQPGLRGWFRRTVMGRR